MRTIVANAAATHSPAATSASTCSPCMNAGAAEGAPATAIPLPAAATTMLSGVAKSSPGSKSASGEMMAIMRAAS